MTYDTYFGTFYILAYITKFFLYKETRIQQKELA